MEEEVSEEDAQRREIAAIALALASLGAVGSQSVPRIDH